MIDHYELNASARGYLNNASFQESRDTLAFFALAYTLSWLAWITLFELRLSHLEGVGLSIYLAAVLAPHAAALLVTAWRSGRQGVSTFYRTTFRPAPLLWIAVAIVLPPLVFLTRAGFATALHLSHDSVFLIPSRTIPLLIFGQAAVVLGEEPGWRGFALPRLTARMGPQAASLVLGVAWACWHLPLFIVAGTSQYGTPFVPFLLTLTAYSFVMTLLVRRAASVTVAMLFHASANICDYTMWAPADPVAGLLPWIIVAAIAAFAMRPKPAR